MNLQSPKVLKVWLALLLLTPLVLWVLPATFFDEGQVLCPSKLLLHLECFGCGMTRAIMHMHHFDIDSAVFYNMGSLVVYPVLIGLWCLWVYQTAVALGWWSRKK